MIFSKEKTLLFGTPQTELPQAFYPKYETTEERIVRQIPISHQIHDLPPPTMTTTNPLRHCNGKGNP